MADYTNIRKFYSASNEFLSGSNSFSGYVLRNGGNFTDLGLNPLTAAPSFSTDLFQSEYFRDRIITDTLELPYSLSSIQIKVNDIVTNRLINDKFGLLYQNNTYLYKSLQSPNNYLPASNNTRYATLSSIDGVEQFIWYDTFADGIEYTSSTNYQQFEYISHGLGVISEHDENVYSLFCVSSSHFISLTGTNSELTCIEQSQYIEQQDNDHTFGYISSMDYVNGFLYICDKGNNVVYKYDVTSYSTGDTGYHNRRILVDSIGSKGLVSDKALFNAPSIIACAFNRVAIYDSGNKVIKIYDNNFNFKLNLYTGNFKREPAVAMRYNRFTNELYVITITTSRGLRLYRVQSDFTFSSPVDLTETLEDDEEVKDISFSSNDSNYWYLTTTQYVYKKLINKPSGNIGAYDSGKIFTFVTFVWNYCYFTYNSADAVWNSTTNKTSRYGDFIGTTMEPSVGNYEKAFLFKYGRFYKFDEPNDFLNILDFFNKTNYSLNNIRISNEEFIQPAVYNKEIYKLISNLLALKNNIIGRYYGSYDFNGVYRLLGYDYNIDLDSFVIDNINNAILHLNEGINYYSINRTLTVIYNLQQVLLAAIAIEIEGLVPYPATSNTLIVD